MMLSRYSKIRGFGMAIVVTLLAMNCGSRVDLFGRVDGGAPYGAPNTDTDTTFGAGGTTTSSSPTAWLAGGVPNNGGNSAMSIGGNTYAPISAPASFSGCLSVMGGNYASIGFLSGYAYTFTAQSTATGAGPVTITPLCNSAGCEPAFAANAICAAGAVGAAADNGSSAGAGFNVYQPFSTGAFRVPGDTMPFRARYIQISFSNATGSALRVRLTTSTTGSGDTYCYDISGAASPITIPITSFNTKCWDNTGVALTPYTGVAGIELYVPSGASTSRQFDFCLQCISTFGT